MEPHLTSGPTSLTVSQLTGQIRDLLEGSLSYVRVRGEILDLKAPPSGHVYFMLGDGEAQIRAVIWRTTRLRLPRMPAHGEAVLVTGRVTVYAPRGEYQLVVEGLMPAGAGHEREKLLQLHARLSAEGLFDNRRKRPLPLWPAVIGVVTSRSGAALQDILRTLDHRIKGYHLILAHARVQGEGAAEEIAQALDLLNRDGRCQVILCGRGGGSAEDLSAFNSELVVRALARSRIPVISAVGHEVDTTLADLVADVRAATPTAAAQLAVPDRQVLQERLDDALHHLVHGMGQILTQRQTRLLQLRRLLRHPRQRIEAYRRLCDELPERLRLAMLNLQARQRHHLDFLQQRLQTWPTSRQWGDSHSLLIQGRQRLTSAIIATLHHHRQRLAQAEARLQALSPQGVLARGFALVFDTNGNLVRHADHLQAGAVIRVELAQGRVHARVVPAGDNF